LPITRQSWGSFHGELGGVSAAAASVPNRTFAFATV
jgi:hypothetical protein